MPDNGLPTLDVLSYGGGIDSFTMLVKACELDEPPDVIVFADVGDPAGQDPAEWPGTYRHIREVAMPLAAHFKIPFYWLNGLDYPVRGERSLFALMWKMQTFPLTVNRLCTIASKTERIDQFLENHYPGHNIVMWIGFEAGEESRLASDPYAAKYEGGGVVPREPRRKTDTRLVAGTLRANRYPLMEWELCRCRSERYVESKGLPIPRKSACTFCSFSRRGDWWRLAHQLPETFQKVAELEERRPLTESGKKLRYVFDSKKGAGTPLPQVIQNLEARGGPRERSETCEVCGGPRSQKAPGCDFMPAAGEAA